MKKIYLTLTMLSLVTMMSFGQKVAIFCTPVTDPVDGTVKTIEDSILAAWPGITTEIINAATIVDMVAADFEAYDAAVLTEWGGSASTGNFGIIGNMTIPWVSLKAYGLRRSAPQWHWIVSSDATQWWNQPKTDTVELDGITPNPLFADAYVGIVKEPTHPIFGNYFTTDEEFAWTTGYIKETNGTAYAAIDPHVQCVNLKNSSNVPVNAASTMLATNKRAITLDDGSAVDGWMWAVEENDSSKRGVVWGVHHLMCGQANDNFYKILQNSLAWVLKHEIPNVKGASGINELNANEFNLKCMPNPASDQLQISFKLNEYSLVSLNVKDMLGRNVFEQHESMNAGSQEVNINISDFASGIYLYQITVNGKTQISKFIAE